VVFAKSQIPDVFGAFLAGNRHLADDQQDEDCSYAATWQFHGTSSTQKGLSALAGRANLQNIWKRAGES
jgi:hypothetical protein